MNGDRNPCPREATFHCGRKIINRRNKLYNVVDAKRRLHSGGKRRCLDLRLGLNRHRSREALQAEGTANAEALRWEQI